MASCNDNKGEIEGKRKTKKELHKIVWELNISRNLKDYDKIIWRPALWSHVIPGEKNALNERQREQKIQRSRK